MVKDPYYSDGQHRGERLLDFLPFWFAMEGEGPRGCSIWFFIEYGEIAHGRAEPRYFEPAAVLDFWVAEIGRKKILEAALKHAQDNWLPTYDALDEALGEDCRHEGEFDANVCCECGESVEAAVRLGEPESFGGDR